MKASFFAAGLAALALAACSTVDPYTGDAKLSATAGVGVAGATTGAVMGAIAGKAAGGDPRLAALIGAGIGGIAGASIGHYMDQQESELRAQLQGTGVSVTRAGNQIVLNMPSNITFAIDSSTVQPGFNQTLVAVGLVLRKFNQTLVDVYGFTDDTGTVDHNNALSQRRAVAVATIVANQGVDQRRIHVEGRGENDPIASNATENGRAQNRRVEIQISPIQKG